MTFEEMEKLLNETLELNYDLVNLNSDLLDQIQDLKCENAKLLSLANNFRTEYHEMKRSYEDLLTLKGGFDYAAGIKYPSKD